MDEYLPEGAIALIDELEAELHQDGLGAWYHSPKHALKTHVLLIRIRDVEAGSCPFVVSATGATDWVALQKAVEALRAM